MCFLLFVFESYCVHTTHENVLFDDDYDMRMLEDVNQSRETKNNHTAVPRNRDSGCLSLRSSNVHTINVYYAMWQNCTHVVAVNIQYRNGNRHRLSAFECVFVFILKRTYPAAASTTAGHDGYLNSVCLIM